MKELLKIKNAATLLAVGVISYLGTSYFIRYKFEQIGCNCGPVIELNGIKDIPVCGCASQFAFSRQYSWLIYAVPLIAIILTVSVILVRNKRS